MPIIGIVCEYNPFHNGHKHLIDSVKKENDVVVAVMSGNFVQRAEPAIFPKEERVKSALMNGVDIVIELPFVYATATAEIFAHSAVTILDSVGCDKIAFGAENDNASMLMKSAEILSSDEFYKKTKKYLDNGISYSSARQSAFDEYDLDFDISSPNNILALEYLKAIKKLNSNIKAVPIKRLGAGYNEKSAEDNFASATYLRELIFSKQSYDKFVPSNVKDIYEQSNKIDLTKYDIAITSLLRSRMTENLSDVANMAEGLENRIKSAVNENINLKSIYDTAKTKRYAYSRIRRAVLSTAFMINESDIKIPVPYCRLLGFNEKSSEKLGVLSKKSKLPFVVSYKDIVKLNSKNAERIFELENKSTNFYNLILQNPQKCSAEMTFSPIKLK